ncbi:MAG: hypothetical protein CMO46_04085 [Verrucomicrobiales bacterium]|nr:hypothetical protein [Verrucomicrobiales bacterium]MBD28991.1 hypothetical protein [Verrucomicrobiaceae bacterium]MBV63041.1 hypothetical protein [Rickettsiales bacterium]|tara:strand:+ start:934 stop:1491 length:558 start_codon:yes stop_codon:yes gene_type:complete
MVCQPNLLPLLKFGDYEVVSYEARWLSDEITKAANKAGHQDWFFAPDITRAVIEYLKNRFPKNTITIEELYNKIEMALAFMGCEDIARTLEIGPPPVRISLMDIAIEAGSGFELEFFRILREKLIDTERSGTSQIMCFELRKAVKHLTGAGRWNSKCVELTEEINDYIISELARNRSGEISLVLK